MLKHFLKETEMKKANSNLGIFPSILDFFFCTEVHVLADSWQVNTLLQVTNIHPLIKHYKSTSGI